MFNKQIGAKLFKQALNVLPGGVNSPDKAFLYSGIKPVYFKNSKGSKLISVNNKSFTDFNCSGGAVIMGHSHPLVLKALVNQIKRGINSGATTKIEIEFAELLIKTVPGIQKVRMVNSGTEASIIAARLARAFTGKNKIIIFEGCDHGFADSFISNRNEVNNDLNIQTIPGIPLGVSDDTLVTGYNDLAGAKALFKKYSKEIAAVIVEPVATNMGCVLPMEGFLEGLRSLCDEHKALLIMDEVTTGFRLSVGGAQEYFKINADIVIFGKLIGGGLPVGAVAGKNEIMDLLGPEGTVYQTGTFSVNPLALSMGYRVVKYLFDNPKVYKSLGEKTKQFTEGLKEVLDIKNRPVTVNQIGTMFSVHFTENEVINYSDVQSMDFNLYKSFYKHLINNGIFFPPSPFKTCFISTLHTDRDLRKTIRVIKKWKNG